MQSCQRWSQCNTTAKYQTRLLFWNKYLVENNTCSPFFKTANICYSTTHTKMSIKLKCCPFLNTQNCSISPYKSLLTTLMIQKLQFTPCFFNLYTLSFYLPQNPIFTVLMHANSSPQSLILKYVHVVISVQSQWCPDWSNFMNWLLVKSTEWCVKSGKRSRHKEAESPQTTVKYSCLLKQATGNSRGKI